MDSVPLKWLHFAVITTAGFCMLNRCILIASIAPQTQFFLQKRRNISGFLAFAFLQSTNPSMGLCHILTAQISLLTYTVLTLARFSLAKDTAAFLRLGRQQAASLTTVFLILLRKPHRTTERRRHTEREREREKESNLGFQGALSRGLPWQLQDRRNEFGKLK
jgi:hypothetical protein